MPALLQAHSQQLVEHEQQELMSAETTLVARQALARPVASACCAIRGVSTSASSCSLCCTSC